MKKIFIPLLSVLFLFTACGEPNPKDKLVSLTKDAIEEIEQAKTEKDITAIMDKFSKEAIDVTMGLSAEEAVKVAEELAKDKELEELNKELAETMEKKVKEFASEEVEDLESEE